jgi:hypothetical protein
MGQTNRLEPIILTDEIIGQAKDWRDLCVVRLWTFADFQARQAAKSAQFFRVWTIWHR